MTYNDEFLYVSFVFFIIDYDTPDVGKVHFEGFQVFPLNDQCILLFLGLYNDRLKRVFF